MIMLPVGYLSGETSAYHYYIKDYLGNNRIVADAHGNVEEVNNYYPYGTLMGDSRNTGLQPYKYIGKVLDRTHGLDWNDHGARHYDPVTGRWNTMDKMCEKYYGIPPYHADIDIKILNRNLFNGKINLALWAKHYRNTFLQGR